MLTCIQFWSPRHWSGVSGPIWMWSPGPPTLGGSSWGPPRTRTRWSSPPRRRDSQSTRGRISGSRSTRSRGWAASTCTGGHRHGGLSWYRWSGPDQSGNCGQPSWVRWWSRLVCCNTTKSVVMSPSDNNMSTDYLSTSRRSLKRGPITLDLWHLDVPSAHLGTEPSVQLEQPLALAGVRGPDVKVEVGRLFILNITSQSQDVS